MTGAATENRMPSEQVAGLADGLGAKLRRARARALSSGMMDSRNEPCARFSSSWLVCSGSTVPSGSTVTARPLSPIAPVAITLKYGPSLLTVHTIRCVLPGWAGDVADAVAAALPAVAAAVVSTIAATVRAILFLMF